jgi:hypothetical protein
MALAGLNARAAAACAVLLPVAMPPAASAAEVARDRVEIIHVSDRLLVDVYHAKGIGGALLQMPEREWPAVVIVRLHGFPELESFTATSKAATLHCVLVRPEGQRPVQTCRVGDDSVDVLEREPDYFELRLPRRIFRADDDTIEIRWVDQWR